MENVDNTVDRRPVQGAETTALINKRSVLSQVQPVWDAPQHQCSDSTRPFRSVCRLMRWQTQLGSLESENKTNIHTCEWSAQWYLKCAPWLANGRCSLCCGALMQFPSFIQPDIVFILVDLLLGGCFLFFCPGKGHIFHADVNLCWHGSCGTSWLI